LVGNDLEVLRDVIFFSVQDILSSYSKQEEEDDFIHVRLVPFGSESLSSISFKNV